MSKEMTWQSIATSDPYLSGSIAARGWDWWDSATAESEAGSVGLVGDRRADFLRGWNDELAECEQERKQQLVSEYDEMAAGSEKGDPAAWK
jgi:hypothetical protein